MRPAVKRIALGLTLPVLLLVAWQILADQQVIPRSIFATPTEAGAALARMALDGSLLSNSVVSLRRLVAGMVLGAALGVAAGIAVSISKTLEQLFAPTFSVLAPIPPLAFIPVLIALFGIEEGSKIALITLGTFFIIYAGTCAGLRSVENKYLEVAYLYEKSRFAVLRQILIPAALYHVFANIRIALGLSWVLLLAAELIASSQGLGWLIWDARNFSRPDDMIAGMVAVGILGTLTDVIVVTVQKRMLSWRDDFSGFEGDVVSSEALQ